MSLQLSEVLLLLLLLLSLCREEFLSNLCFKVFYCLHFLLNLHPMTLLDESLVLHGKNYHLTFKHFLLILFFHHHFLCSIFALNPYFKTSHSFLFFQLSFWQESGTNSIIYAFFQYEFLIILSFKIFFRNYWTDNIHFHLHLHFVKLKSFCKWNWLHCFFKA